MTELVVSEEEFLCSLPSVSPSGQALDQCFFGGGVIALKGQGNLSVFSPVSPFSVSRELWDRSTTPGEEDQPSLSLLPSSHLAAGQGVAMPALSWAQGSSRGCLAVSGSLSLAKEGQHPCSPPSHPIARTDLRCRFAFGEYCRWGSLKAVLKWSFECKIFIRNHILGGGEAKLDKGRRQVTKPQVPPSWQGASRQALGECYLSVPTVAEMVWPGRGPASL